MQNATMSIVRVDHVQLAMPAGRESDAIAFYEGILGIAHVPKPAHLAVRGGCWFECGPQQIHCGVEELVAPTRRHPALLTDDLDALRATLEAAGTPIATDRDLPGYRRFYATDPFGNRIEFLEPA